LRLIVGGAESLKQDKFILFIAQLEPSRRMNISPLPLCGLRPDATYRLALHNGDALHPMAAKHQSNRSFDADGITQSGAVLMNYGIMPPVATPQTLWFVHGTSI
jgi:hypothetical protein